MSYKIFQTVEFEKEAKNLSKKYPSFKEDITDLVASLTKDPMQGTRWEIIAIRFDWQ